MNYQTMSYISKSIQVTTFKSILLTVFFICAALIGYSQDFPAKSSHLVTDFTETLSTKELQQLENKLVAFADTTSTQIAVVIMQSTGDYDIADYAVRLAQKWGIGSKEHDNGILLLVALKDRKVTIQTGYGVEGAVPDAIAYRIINSEIKPAFVREAYFTGLDRATDALIKYTKGEYKAAPRSPRGNSGIPVGGIVFFLFLVIIVLRLFSRGGGKGGGGGQVMSGRGTSDLFWWTLLGSMGQGGGRHRSGGGFGGGGFGAGGFGGFGGGSFGGGGASGGW